MRNDAEQQRLREAYEGQTPWLRWGPYLSERQWGTVREDYSADGNAWAYFTHDQAIFRAYRWGEDGLAGISDDRQQLCLGLALWNGADPFLKERLFGLTNGQGNHGEDVKEYYFYLDNTPTHSYLKYLYKYPQRAFPYEELVTVSGKRSRKEGEYELLDTGIFEEDRYFDVFVEYAKAAPDDILMKVTAFNRGLEAAVLHLLPTIWFRNTWWDDPLSSKPVLRQGATNERFLVIEAGHPELDNWYLYCEGESLSLFTENETNQERLEGKDNPQPYTKDGINAYVVDGQADAVHPGRTGTKAAAYFQREIAAGGSVTLRLRLSTQPPDRLSKDYGWWSGDPFGQHFETILRRRHQEADEFFDAITPAGVGDERRQVLRQALAGMLWNKQYYNYDLSKWLAGHHRDPFITGDPHSPKMRNNGWFHMTNADIISMPDKWEYPWYAAWDLAFQTIALAMVDIHFAKRQLSLMLNERYLHPNGQLPAYEWNFSDVNPPVHAWATLFVYHMDRQRRGSGDVAWLKNAFHKLALNFTWWVNRKDPSQRNVFEGGFLGLDNIGVFDRSRELPTGGYLEQADGTAWMALYCQNMFEIAVELACHDPVYEEMALKFFEHFFYIAGAMDRMGDNQQDMWDDTDGFFFDLLRLPNGQHIRLKVHSMVGLLPLCATSVLASDIVVRFPNLARRAGYRLERHPEWLASMHDPRQPGYDGRRMFAVLNEQKLRRVLSRLLDEDEFLSPYGIRALSRHHAENPYIFPVDGEEYKVEYLPAESDSAMFGGNSNWRGPVWFPVNVLLIRALLQYYSYYGDDFKVECPTGSGQEMTLFEVSREIASRLEKLFLKDEEGRRPVYGDEKKFQEDPHWRDYLLFYEYFHGDNGRGLGASHQTGWTGLVAWLIQLYGSADAGRILEEGFRPAIVYRK